MRIFRPMASNGARTSMIDIIYLVTGAAFLAVCVVYVVACDRL
jgi:hypothetical protein